MMIVTSMDLFLNLFSYFFFPLPSFLSVFFAGLFITICFKMYMLSALPLFRIFLVFFEFLPFLIHSSDFLKNSLWIFSGISKRRCCALVLYNDVIIHKSRDLLFLSVYNICIVLKLKHVKLSWV